MSFRLWSDEIEAMRAEARHVVDTRRCGDAARGQSRPRCRATSASRHAARMHVVPPEFTVPEAVDREIAGVPCRVIASDAPRAVYLHFHGGGMVAGSPMMMDIPNRALARAITA